MKYLNLIVSLSFGAICGIAATPEIITPDIEISSDNRNDTAVFSTPLLPLVQSIHQLTIRIDDDPEYDCEKLGSCDPIEFGLDSMGQVFDHVGSEKTHDPFPTRSVTIAFMLDGNNPSYMYTAVIRGTIDRTDCEPKGNGNGTGKSKPPEFTVNVEGPSGLYKLMPEDPYLCYNSGDTVTIDALAIHTASGPQEECPSKNWTITGGPEGVDYPVREDGNHDWPITATADLLPGVYTISATSVAPEINAEPVTLHVIGVTSVEWIKIDSPIGENPVTHGGGWRIFPGMEDMNDPTDRTTVLVRATITPPLQGIVVHFKLFDVDDPWTNDAPIDHNGPSGTDNINDNAALSQNVVATDHMGISETILSVSWQPGNNYRVGANCDLLTGATNHNVPSGGPSLIPGINGRFTDLLTVWRYLHVEVDRMTPPTYLQNTIAATYRNPVVSTPAGGSVITLTYTPALGVADPANEGFPPHDNHWINGGVHITTGGISSEVHTAGIFKSTIGLFSSPTISFRAAGVGGSGAFTGAGDDSGFLRLGDDDFWDKSPPEPQLDLTGAAPAAFVDATVGTGSPTAVTGLGADGEEFFRNAYREAYVESVFPRDVVDSYAFEKNSAVNAANFPLRFTSNKDLSNSQPFWSCNVVMLFQPEPSLDFDADVGDIRYGFSLPAASDDRALVYSETLAESVAVTNTTLSRELGGTAAHEVGHLFRNDVIGALGHEPAGIMRAEFLTTDDGGTFSFDTKTIREIRSRVF